MSFFALQQKFSEEYNIYWYFQEQCSVYILQRIVKVGMIRILIREKEELRHERIEPDRKEKGHEHGQDHP